MSLLGGGKENRNKDKLRDADKEDRTGRDSVSSSEHPDEPATDAPIDAPLSQATSETAVPTLFSSTSAPGKKKSISRPKHNIRTTSSSFVTRLQTAEGLSKTLQSKAGDSTFVFYNAAKSFFWTEAGVKAKV